jgi:hypothetical protein
MLRERAWLSTNGGIRDQLRGRTLSFWLSESKASAGFVSTATRFGTTKASRSSVSIRKEFPL